MPCKPNCKNSESLTGKEDAERRLAEEQQAESKLFS